VPEAFMVRDRHDNRALVVLENDPLPLREFYVPLRGPEIDLSLLQPLKFWAVHLDLLRKVLRQSEIRAEHSLLRDISPLVKAAPDICCHAPKEQDACQ
jgi:hypothetical protein